MIAQPTEELDQLEGFGGVHPGGGLVEEQELRSERHGAGDL
jgi:hypothetical protein